MKPELTLVEDTGSQLAQDAKQAPEPPPQQTEMPFAVVEGEPLTELPRDLYIPPDALQVFLEAFEGPLDLLLYLIRRQNLDILDIPIAEITRQYMKYIEVMAELQLELAGEYLLMAAMLAEIKSRMLLPRPPAAEGEEEEDPRAELVRRLQEYERFKKAAEDIDQLARMERDTIIASAELQERKVVKLVPEVSLEEMLKAIKDVLSRAEMFAHHRISRERLSVRERMTHILDQLQESDNFCEFVRLFRPEEGRMGVTVTFSAVLELLKGGMIEIAQAEPYAPLHVRVPTGKRKVISDEASADADAQNQAALAQPAFPDEDELDDELEELSSTQEGETGGDPADADPADADADAADDGVGVVVDGDAETIDQVEAPTAEGLDTDVPALVDAEAADMAVSADDDLGAHAEGDSTEVDGHVDVGAAALVVAGAAALTVDAVVSVAEADSSEQSAAAGAAAPFDTAIINAVDPADADVGAADSPTLAADAEIDVVDSLDEAAGDDVDGAVSQESFVEGELAATESPEVSADGYVHADDSLDAVTQDDGDQAEALVSIIAPEFGSDFGADADAATATHAERGFDALTSHGDEATDYRGDSADSAAADAQNLAALAQPAFPDEDELDDELDDDFGDLSLTQAVHSESDAAVHSGIYAEPDADEEAAGTGGEADAETGAADTYADVDAKVVDVDVDADAEADVLFEGLAATHDFVQTGAASSGVVDIDLVGDADGETVVAADSSLDASDEFADQAAEVALDFSAEDDDSSSILDADADQLMDADLALGESVEHASQGDSDFPVEDDRTTSALEAEANELMDAGYANDASVDPTSDAGAPESAADEQEPVDVPTDERRALDPDATPEDDMSEPDAPVAQDADTRHE